MNEYERTSREAIRKRREMKRKKNNMKEGTFVVVVVVVVFVVCTYPVWLWILSFDFCTTTDGSICMFCTRTMTNAYKPLLRLLFIFNIKWIYAQSEIAHKHAAQDRARRTHTNIQHMGWQKKMNERKKKKKLQSSWYFPIAKWIEAFEEKPRQGYVCYGEKDNVRTRCTVLLYFFDPKRTWTFCCSWTFPPPPLSLSLFFPICDTRIGGTVHTIRYAYRSRQLIAPIWLCSTKHIAYNDVTTWLYTQI